MKLIEAIDVAKTVILREINVKGEHESITSYKLIKNRDEAIYESGSILIPQSTNIIETDLYGIYDCDDISYYEGSVLIITTLEDTDLVRLQNNAKHL